MLCVNQVSVSIKNTKILKQIEFIALPGEVTAIIGANGSGKSTLMRAMSGDIPYDGKISLNGRDIGSIKPYELASKRAVMPQKSNVAFPFTVAEVVHIGLRNGVGAETTRTIYDALRCVGLATFARRKYSDLSGGEQQRVQLARVLAQVWTPHHAGQARWIFLDEPVSSLDIAHQIDVMNIVKDYACSGGGIVAIMHDLNITSMFADKVAILHRGKRLCQGVPKDVMTDDWLSDAYDCDLRVNKSPKPPSTYILPHLANTRKKQLD
ncbi:MAG: heme ABC transporter ATP-binding protein [Paracoccaceae bacterium]|nr:heme ABC transporter ATP-binding protein [Paracoccaceae bacterium]